MAESLHEPQSPEVSRRLFQMMAELAPLAGWMAYDEGWPGVAQRYYLLGLSACQQARSPVLGAKILGDMTQLSTALYREVYAEPPYEWDAQHAELFSKRFAGQCRDAGHQAERQDPSGVLANPAEPDI